MENHDYDDEKATDFWIKIPVGASNKNPEINKRSKKRLILLSSYLTVLQDEDVLCDSSFFPTPSKDFFWHKVSWSSIVSLPDESDRSLGTNRPVP